MALLRPTARGPRASPRGCGTGERENGAGMKDIDIRADGTGDAMPLARDRRRRWSVGLGCRMLLAGCAHGLTGAQREAMLLQYGAWQPRIVEYATIAKAAYRDPEEANPPARLVVSVQTFGSDSKAYILLTDDDKRKHRIAIEGTRKNWRDFEIDANALPRPDTRLGIRTHPGFAAVADAVYVDLVTNARLKPRYTVGLTGHSLGGAAAVLLAMYLEGRGITVDEVMTFGQPMATEAEGVRAYEPLMAKTLRVVACDDVIPLLPPAGYAPGGRMLLLLDGARFEFVSESVDRAFMKALLDVSSFSGHRMDTYQERLRVSRTEPWRYSELDQRYCSGK